MRYRARFAAVCVLVLASCDSSITAADFDCEEGLPKGELHVVMGPGSDPFGLGENVFLGDSLALTAEVRPVVGATFDLLGSGGCRTEYGAPIPASIEWSSSDIGIATVSATGLVIGRREGSAAVTAHAPARNLVSSRKIAVRIRAADGP